MNNLCKNEKGDKVKIYNNKITGKPIFEGEAELIAFIDIDERGEFWLVKFLDDNFITHRYVQFNEDQ